MGEGIFNLTGQEFSADQTKVLDLGLKFAPQKPLDKFETYIDFNLFIRKLNLKKFFLTQTPSIERQTEDTVDKQVVHTNLRNKSLFNPMNTQNQCIEVFKQLVIKDLENLQISRTKMGTNKLNTTIKALQNNTEVVFKSADKGGGLVAIKKQDYINEMSRLLQDQETYQELPGDPLRRFSAELVSLLDSGAHKGYLNSKERDYLCPKAPRTPVIYYLPKVHKNAEAPPGRPIVSGLGSITSRLGEYVDKFLQPLVAELPSYLKDTTSVLNLVQSLKIEQKDTFLVTADITSLYTIIPHQLGMEAVRFYLEAGENLGSGQAQFIMECLNFALQHNYFWFNGSFYLQTKGVAMGAKFAPSMANLFVGWWEVRFIYNVPRPMLPIWKRYIDDVLMVWTGTRETLEEFLVYINDNDWNLVYTSEVSQDTVHFLDLQLRIQGDRINTSTYFKSTDRNGYVPTQSCHHPNWLKAIPKGQFTRLRRNCSEVSQYYQQAELLKIRFLEKGYAGDKLDKVIKEIGECDRSKLFSTRPKSATSGSKAEFSMITGFNIHHKQVEKILKKHWPILKEDKILGPVLPGKPQVIYRRAPSLATRITKSAIDEPRTVRMLDQKGFYRCGKCMMCKQTAMKERKSISFKSNQNNKVHKLKDTITCNTTGVVYMLECPCGLQYVGRTIRALKTRLYEHCYNIRKGLETHSVSLHYKLVHGSDPSSLKFWGIDKVKPSWRGELKIRSISRLESKWIFQLQTLSPKGLNVDFDMNCFLDNS